MKYDEDGRPVDAVGRVYDLHLLTAIPWLRVMPVNPVEIFDKQVPDEFTSQDVDKWGRQVCVVACQCGGEPKVPLGLFASCEKDWSECNRFFWWDGHSVRVAYVPEGWTDPDDQPQTPAAS